ncbi:MAG: glycosyltransferase family 4 protein [Thermoplasmata archaeon]|nr:MAG: glycosyltransferase family 4 protein [Thermoplasmata archaeon]
MVKKIYELGEYDSRMNVGVVTAVNPLVKYLKRLDLDIEYITHDNMPKKGVFTYYKLLSNLNFHFPGLRLTRHFRNLWAIRAIQEIEKNAILHIQSFTLLPHLLQSLNIPKRVVLTYYGGHLGIIDDFGRTNPYYLRSILNIPDVVIADELDSTILHDRAKRYFPGNEEALKERMVIFPFIGIDSEVFDPNKVIPYSWDRQNIHKDGLIVFKGGAIERMKGDSTLIKIAKNVLSKRKDVTFVWGGYFHTYPAEKPEALKMELRGLCDKYPKNAFYMGRYELNELPSLLKGADVVPHFHKKIVDCLSTFGRESLMMGSYMMAANIGWYRNLMDKSKGLHVFEWADDDRLIKEATDELIYLADNIDETRKKGLENRKYAMKYCSAKVSALQHKMIYEALANDEPHPTTKELLSIAHNAGK